MKQIFKYPLYIQDLQEIEVPEGAIILSVQNQREEIFIWAEVEASRSLVKYKILILGTGRYIPEFGINEFKRQFIGTVQELNGTLVWHIYLLKKD